MKIYKASDDSSIFYINLNKPKNSKDLRDFKLTYTALSFKTILNINFSIRDTIVVLYDTEILSFFITNIMRKRQSINSNLILSSIECYYQLNLEDYAKKLPIKDKDFKKALMIKELLR